MEGGGRMKEDEGGGGREVEGQRVSEARGSSDTVRRRRLPVIGEE